MFFLGVMVGRGNSPVTFDTQGFQNRLASLVKAQGEHNASDQDVTLKFHKVLDKPVAVKKKVTRNSEIVPSTEPLSQSDGVALSDKDGIPIKLSKKLQTLNPELLAAYQDAARSVPSRTASQNTQVVKPLAPKKQAPESSGVTYTIQVAAFKTAGDAATEMARLNKKGIHVYQVIGKNGDTTWHRLHTGTYGDYQSAKAALETLKNARIEGMIKKKE